jgi:hypothetical protein
MTTRMKRTDIIICTSRHLTMTSQLRVKKAVKMRYIRRMHRVVNLKQKDKDYAGIAIKKD